MSRARVSRSVLLLVLVVLATSCRGTSVTEETTITSTTTTGSTTTNSSLEETAQVAKPGWKIARRIIDDRLSPPARTTEFAAWNKRLPPLGEIHHRLSGITPPRVTEELFDDNGTEVAKPKKTRTVGPTAGAREGESDKPAGSDNKIKSSQQLQESDDELDVERGNSIGGPAPRYHGNRPYEDRYGGSGWKSSSYLGYGKDRTYYDQRNHYAYDRYGYAQRPSSNYAAVDGDRQVTFTLQSSFLLYMFIHCTVAFVKCSSGDRFGVGSRPSNYQAVGGGYGAYIGGNRRPGYGGVSSSLDEPEAEYPFEGEPTGPPGHNIANLQTQKAVALKALAGVALIGAAAALATNPVLLPISVISGRRRRRKRSSSGPEIESDNFALTALLQGYIKPKEPNEVVQDQQDRNVSGAPPVAGHHRQELVISPQCVARLACHVHRDYLDELDKSRAELIKGSTNNGTNGTAVEGNATYDAASDLAGLEHWFDSLIHSNILVADYLSDELKSLIQSAVIVGSNRNETCDQFSCLSSTGHDFPDKKDK
ncbi:uncharacterized protein LOC111643154 [Copidosoma floridanum]|uniref:uncharacterized protein LOC111643154 n=1 Tax=Copidosoma floridanum TaxID=29053 RepID=UPI000C6F59A2|nr:uncharacterized protein LOC111643154 [Copidosoma floridanum]